MEKVLRRHGQSDACWRLPDFFQPLFIIAIIAASGGCAAKRRSARAAASSHRRRLRNGATIVARVWLEPRDGQRRDLDRLTAGGLSPGTPGGRKTASTAWTSAGRTSVERTSAERTLRRRTSRADLGWATPIVDGPGGVLEADLRRTDLSGANLEKADLQGGPSYGDPQ